MLRFVVCVALVCVASCSGGLALAQGLLENGGLRSGSFLTLGVKKFFNSFVSYEWSYPGLGDPAFLLEWPFDQYFVGLQYAYATRGLTVSGEYYQNITESGSKLFEDSDFGPREWGPLYRPGVPVGKASLLLGKCDLTGASLGDLRISYAAPLGRLTAGTAVGVAYQRFSFMALDGHISSVYRLMDGKAFPSIMISFVGVMHHHYVAGFASMALPAVGPLPPLHFLLEARYGGTGFSGRDDHKGLFPTVPDLQLAASGTMRGVKGSLSTIARDFCTLRLEFDVMQMRATGEIDIQTRPITLRPLTVWTEQKLLSLNAEFAF